MRLPPLVADIFPKSHSRVRVVSFNSSSLSKLEEQNEQGRPFKRQLHFDLASMDSDARSKTVRRMLGLDKGSSKASAASSAGGN
jgi:hypothetical protein